MIPLSYAQRRLWFLSMMEQRPTYNVPLALRLRGPLRPDVLETALADVLERHEALRTVFPAVDGEPWQQVVDDAQPAIVAATVTEAELPAALTEAARYVFDLTAELPIRPYLFRTAADDHTLVLVMHHIATDGGSMGPLVRDLAAAYEARLDGRAPEQRAVAGAVRRLHALAARTPRRGGRPGERAGSAVVVLDRAAGRHPGRAGAARRPAPPDRAELPRRRGAVPVRRGDPRRDRRAGPRPAGPRCSWCSRPASPRC